MSQKKHTRARINNSLSELTIGLAPEGTGGSQLSGYSTMAFTNNYNLATLNRILLTYMYSGCGLLQTAIQLPIQDALAKGFEIESGEMSPDDVDLVFEWFDEHNAIQKLIDYRTWVRLYGGGALVINTDQSPEMPMLDRRLRNAPIELYDVDRWQLSIAGLAEHDYLTFDDMTEADTLYLNGQQIHRSRLLMGYGKRAPAYIRRQLRGWGMSEAERMIRDLQLYFKTDDVLFEILDESKLDVYHIEGMANKLATAGGTEIIRNRIQEANKIKSYVSALVLDKNEEFESKQLSFAGLADVKKENRVGVASALRMPMTKLFGLSASGFSTGESDLDNYNEMVKSDVQEPLKPDVRRLVQIACLNIWGRVPSFQIKFPNLKILPELEAAQVRESKANVIVSLFDRGIITDGKSIADELAKEGVISAELAEKANANPIPPAGHQQGAESPTAGNVSIFKKAQDFAASVKAKVTGK
jgi:hypothetical protein